MKTQSGECSQLVMLNDAIEPGFIFFKVMSIVTLQNMILFTLSVL